MSRTRAQIVGSPAPLIVDHQAAAAMLSIEPRDLKKAGDLRLLDYHTHSLAEVKPHRYYLVEDLATLAKKIKDAGCLERLLTSSRAEKTQPAVKPSRTGTRTRPLKGRTGLVLDFEQAVAQTTTKPPAR